MKKTFIVFGSKTFTEKNTGANVPVLNAEASGANGHKTAAIGY
jgi:hypothetical protein